jgi:hypothetical protein
MRSDLDLLALGLTTGFIFDDEGRIMCDNAPDRSRGPRFRLCGCVAGNLVRFGRAVSEETARALEALASDEPPFIDPSESPRHHDDYRDLLAREAAVESEHLGLSWKFPEQLAYQHDAALVRSATPEGDALLQRLITGGIPSALVEMGFVSVDQFWPPWCMAVEEGDIASIAFAARLGPTAAATGLNTVPSFRGRGFGAAATAGWATHPALASRTLFYAAERTNYSSRRVTDRLGLEFIGMELSIT